MVITASLVETFPLQKSDQNRFSKEITLLIHSAGRNHFETLVMFMNYEKLRHLTNQSDILHTNIIYANLWTKIILEVQMHNHRVIFE